MAFTYFFRDLQTLELVVEHLIPTCIGRSSIKIWDAGCASGEEPYTLAILFAERLGRFSFKNIRIVASDIDISDQFGRIIEGGVYHYDQLKRIPDMIFKKYFSMIEGTEHYRIDSLLRERIMFRRENLLDLQSPGNDFSLVLCKNVLLHFQPEERIEVLKMFHNTLTQGGFLAMEQTQKLPDEVMHLFEPVVANAQLYRKA